MKGHKYGIFYIVLRGIHGDHVVPHVFILEGPELRDVLRQHFAHHGFGSDLRVASSRLLKWINPNIYKITFLSMACLLFCDNIHVGECKHPRIKSHRRNDRVCFCFFSGGHYFTL